MWGSNGNAIPFWWDGLSLKKFINKLSNLQKTTATLNFYFIEKKIKIIIICTIFCNNNVHTLSLSAF